MNEKFCPFISTDEKKRTCQKDCTFFSEMFQNCRFKIEKEEKKITVMDGFRIAFGFSLWGIFIVMIIHIILNFIIQNIIT